MEFVKVPLSLMERLRALKSAVEWLSLVYIPAHDYDTGKSWIEHFPFRERFECFLAEIETAISGCVYEMVEEEKRR